MTRGRVLLVDDSVVVRRLVTELLGEDPLVESVVTAPNGRIALEKLDAVNPDLVILDVEMPELGGIETLRLLRARAPQLPVLMFSGYTERAGTLTLDALSLGASDYVTKPTAAGGTQRPIEVVREELLRKSRALLRRRLGPAASRSAHTAAVSSRPEKGGAPAAVELLVLGASTGGPQALSEIITRLPAGWPTPILVVQHMPPMFTQLFATRLDSQSKLRVREAVMGAECRPGEVWIAPGDYHLAVHRHGRRLALHVHQGPPENSCRPAVDVLFRSVADACGAGVLACVLTGMGSDGLRGAEHIRAAGGQVWVQDEPSSVVWSMPGSIAQAGFADAVLPLDAFAGELSRRVMGSGAETP